MLHDLGRTNDEKDDTHGAKSVRRIIKEHIDIPELHIGRRGREAAQFIIRYHSLPDEAGYKAIRKNSRLSREEAEHLKLLYEICKDIDGLDRVRFNGLDIEQLRTPYAPEGWLSLRGLFCRRRLNKLWNPSSEALEDDDF